MDRRSFLTGAASLATLAGVRNADALTQAEKELLLGSAGIPPPPQGYVYLLGADSAYLLGADGAYLLGVAP